MGSVTPHHKVVCLDAYLCPVPTFDFPHQYVEYENTIGEDLIIERVRDATIIITTRYDIIDMEACRSRCITVFNSPSASAESVAEHAIALFLAAKRMVIGLHNVTLKGEEWPRAKSAFHLYKHLPRVNRHETLGIIGYGALGKHVEKVGTALGMSVLIAERKTTVSNSVRPGRRPFDEVLQTCTVLIVACSLDAGSRNMIAEAELRSMRRDSIVVNVARGGVIDEASLVKALNEGWIASAATDVFTIEPATTDSTPFIAELPPNLILSPHVAWYADATLETLQALIKESLEGFVAQKPVNVVKESWPIYRTTPR